MKVYEAKRLLKKKKYIQYIYQPYLDQIYSVGYGLSNSEWKSIVLILSERNVSMDELKLSPETPNCSFYSILKVYRFYWKISTFSLEDTDLRSVLGYSRNSACTVFIISTKPYKILPKWTLSTNWTESMPIVSCSFQQHLSLWSTSKSLKHQIADLIEWFIFPLQESHEWLVLRYVFELWRTSIRKLHTWRFLFRW